MASSPTGSASRNRSFGTSYRIVNLVAGLQLFTIVATRGNVITLGEAYAFGVIWSFTFNALAMLVLRWKYKGERGWKVPPNIRIGKTEIPIGLISVFMVLFSTAIVNLFTKSVATVSGIAFAAAFFIIFSLSERQNQRRHALTDAPDEGALPARTSGHRRPRVSSQIRPGCVMVTMRDAANPLALKWALARTDTDEQDVVVLTARMMGVGGPELLDASEQLFSEHEQMLFTKAVSVAESFGKHISPARGPRRRYLRRAGADRQFARSCIGSLRTFHQNDRRRNRLTMSARHGKRLPEPKRQFTFYVVMARWQRTGLSHWAARAASAAG